MPEAMDRLIERLAADAAPVRRLRPPAVRAALWLLAVAAVGAVGVATFADLPVFAHRARDPMLALELAGTLLTAIAAVWAACALSVPGRSPLWALLPLPSLALWIGSSGYSCVRNWLDAGAGGSLGESAVCFQFILGASVPLGAALWLMLRQARPLAPVRVAAVGGLGVASLAAFFLQFFHPFDVTFMDLAVHAVAVGIVIAVLSLAGGRADRGAAAA